MQHHTVCSSFITPIPNNKDSKIADDKQNSCTTKFFAQIILKENQKNILDFKMIGVV